MTLEEKMKMDAQAIADDLKAGRTVTKENMKFFKSYVAVYGGKAGNAGKRNGNKSKVQKIK